MVLLALAPSSPELGRTDIPPAVKAGFCALHPVDSGPRFRSVTSTVRSLPLQPNSTLVFETRSQLMTGVGDGCGVDVGHGVAVACGTTSPALLGLKLMKFCSEPLASTIAIVSNNTPAAPNSARIPRVRGCKMDEAPSSEGCGAEGHAGAPKPPWPPRYMPSYSVGASGPSRYCGISASVPLDSTGGAILE